MVSEKPVLSQKADGVEMDNLATNGPEATFNKHANGSHKSASPKLRRSPSKPAHTVDGFVAAFCAWIVDHQIGISVNLMLLLTLTHLCFPKSRQYTRKFFTLSYYNPVTGRYGIGSDDLCIVGFWLTVFTGVRIIVMDYVMTPLTGKLGLVKKDKTRFAEQAWILLYPSIFWSLGMYLMYKSSYWLNFTELWTNWPDREVDGLFKLYYLIQFSFWVQQIVVVNIEERRKDHWQMFTHHIVTCALMFTSYIYYYTKVGNLILCLMDAVDVVLPAAKILKYLKYRKACDCAFGLFMVTWLITRHIFYGKVIHSIMTDYYRVAEFGCYTGSALDIQGPFPPPKGFAHLLRPFRDPGGMICQTQETTYVFLFLLFFLQAILLVWFTMIIKVLIRVIRGEGADDVRSDDEGEDEEEEEIVENGEAPGPNGFIEVPPLEEEVGAESISYSGKKSGSSKRTRKNHAVASGVSLTSDKKELLGRIGCDKGS